eukprot:gene18474-biopygen20450
MRALRPLKLCMVHSLRRVMGIFFDQCTCIFRSPFASEAARRLGFDDPGSERRLRRWCHRRGIYTLMFGVQSCPPLGGAGGGGSVAALNSGSVKLGFASFRHSILLWRQNECQNPGAACRVLQQKLFLHQ